MIEELLANPAALGAVGTAALMAVFLLSKFAGLLKFEQDQSAFRNDLMSELKAEREQTKDVMVQLVAQTEEVSKLRSEVMRLRVVTEATRNQLRQLLSLLHDVKEGRVAPEHIRVPDMENALVGEG